MEPLLRAAINRAALLCRLALALGPLIGMAINGGLAADVSATPRCGV